VNVKGKARGGPEQLAAHLENAEQNESVKLIAIHGLMAGDLRGALIEMDALGTMLRTDRTLYSGSINPDPKEREPTDEEWAYLEKSYIKKMGFEGQPYAVIEHEKFDQTGILRKHRHLVHALTDLEHMRAIRTDHNYRKHEEIARDGERYLGHARVQGAHAERFGNERPERAPTQQDYQQAKWTRIDPKEAKALGAQLWRASDSGKALAAGLEAHGWILARGDKQRADGGAYFMAIDPRGGTHELRRMVPVRAAELYKRMADIDAASLPGVAEAKTRQRARQATHEAQRRYEALTPFIPLEQTNTLLDGLARAPERPLNRTQGDLRLAFTLSKSREELSEALAGRNIALGCVSALDARANADQRKLYREQKKLHEQWKAKAAFNRYAVLTPEPEQPRYVAPLKKGEIVAVDGSGQVYRLDKRTTALDKGEIEKRLALIDAGSLPNIADAKAAMIETRRERDHSAWRDEQDRQRPATAIEQKIIDCREQAGIHGADVRTWKHIGDVGGDIVSRVDALADRLKPEKERQTESSTIRGDRAFAARLDQAGIAIARASAADVTALDKLRDEEAEARAAAKNVQARKAQSFAKVKEGDIVAVTRQGNVFRLNPHRIDLAGLESAISSTVAQSKRLSSGLPGVIATRMRFAAENEKIDKIWQARREGSQARRAEREKSFTRNRTISRGVKAALREPGEAVNQSLKRGGKGLSALGRGIAAGIVNAIGEFLFPTTPPTPEQQERNYHAAKEQQATDDIKARQDETDEQRRQHRQTQEKDTELAKILGTAPGSPANNLHRAGDEEQQRQRQRELRRDR
jgi:hypothetical protein